MCRPQPTLVFYMGHKALDALCRNLVANGLPAATPAAMIENGTLPRQRVVRARLDRIAATVDAARLEGPALLIIGAVVAALEPLPSPAEEIATRPRD